MCLTCGYLGCCDSSPLRHADEHHIERRHPVMRSAEPGEAWRWCYVDELLGLSDDRMSGIGFSATPAPGAD